MKQYHVSFQSFHLQPLLLYQCNIIYKQIHSSLDLVCMHVLRTGLQERDSTPDYSVFANALETNKINLELLNVKTEASLNETALRNKQQELNTLNGNIPVVFEENQYPAIPFPSDYQMG